MLPQREIDALVTLAEERPLIALDVSAGRLRQSRDFAPDSFFALYIPNPHSDEYVVLLNANLDEGVRNRALARLVKHHVLAHNRVAVYVLAKDVARCKECTVPHQIHTTPEQRSMRALQRRNYAS